MAEANHEKAVALAPERLPYHPSVQERFGIDRASWRALVDAVFPAAKTPESVILALSYCRARKLDPFKRPVHIVPMWSSALRQEVETVWPGIGELRTTACRTQGYAGIDPATFGPEVERTFSDVDSKSQRVTATVTYPEWCQVTVYRVVGGQRVAFAGPRVRWTETFSARGKAKVPNDRWARAPYQMIEKVAEAAALRRAFPEEVGEVMTADEMEGRVLDSGAGAIDVTPESAPDPKAEALRARLDVAKRKADPHEPAQRGESPAAEPETPPTQSGPADVAMPGTRELVARISELIAANPGGKSLARDYLAQCGLPRIGALCGSQMQELIGQLSGPADVPGEPPTADPALIARAQDMLASHPRGPAICADVAGDPTMADLTVAELACLVEGFSEDELTHLVNRLEISPKAPSQATVRKAGPPAALQGELV